MKSFVLAKATLEEAFIEELVAIPPQRVSLDLQEKNIMSVYVPEMHFTVKDETEESDFKYGYLNSNSEIDDSVEQISSVLNELLELTEIEKTCQLLADEIEKTRRRVNALEYRLIPQFRRNDLLYRNEAGRKRESKYHSYYESERYGTKITKRRLLAKVARSLFDLILLIP